MLIGTAGHIDHGKTSLIRRLTGRDTDRLPEEVKRGISIELGYAYVPVGAGMLGFVDVPGHERFVHTMLAGATGIDFALLVVAADDGVMPQTDEHLDILMLLGIGAGAIAITKTDAVAAERVDAVRAEIAARVQSTAAAAWPVFAMSSASGEGIDTLLSHLLAEAARHEQRDTRGHFRMAIDRCFTLTGIGTVVTGTVHAGVVRVGEEVAVMPTAHGRLATRVRSIHAQDQPAVQGVAGQRCAVSLVGLEKAQIERGMWVQSTELDNVTERVDVSLQLSARQAKALAAMTHVHVHHGTADALARLAVLDGARVEPGTQALVSLTLDRPLAACRGDRFVVRDASAQRTLGGGVVLDVTPQGAVARRGRRAPARLHRLTQIRDRDYAQALRAWLAEQPLTIARLKAAWNLRAEEFAALVTATGARIAAQVVFADDHWRRLHEQSLAAIGDVHLREPEMPGLEQQRLRRIVAPAIDVDAFAAVIDELIADGRVVRRGAFLALPSHRAELAKDQRVRWEKIKPLLAERKFEPPRVRDIAREAGIPEVEVRHLLKTVARVGEVNLIAHDHYFLAASVAELADIAADIASRDGAARAAPFRDRIGAGRKVAIQILEFFDRVGYTRRVRDDHLIRRGNPWR